MSDLLRNTLHDLVKDGFDTFTWCTDDRGETTIRSTHDIVLLMDVDYARRGSEDVGVVLNLKFKAILISHCNRRKLYLNLNKQTRVWTYLINSGWNSRTLQDLIKMLRLEIRHPNALRQSLLL